MCCSRPKQILAADTRRYTSALSGPRHSDQGRPADNAIFEYTGSSAVTLVSPITRQTYRFERPGARLLVDPRDRSWVAFVPHLLLVLP